MTLAPCRFAILVLLVVTVALAIADQGLESLRVMAEFGNASQVGAREPYLVRLLLFFLGAVILASSAWYFSRQALLLEPPRKPVSRQEAVLFTWTPRVLGAFGFVCPGIALWAASGQYGVHEGADQILSPRVLLRVLGILFALLGLLFGAALALRRSLFGIEGLSIPERSRKVKQLPAGTRVVLWSSTAVTVALFVAVIMAPIRLTSFVATPTVILVCSAIWVFAGTVLVLTAARLRLPLFTVLFGLLLVSSLSNDNHRVRSLGPARARPELPQAVEKWLSWMDDNYPSEGERHPVFVVAAEGGGLRAAYWTAAVLAAIHQQFPTFSDHCFAISGVSGGALGAAVFDTLLAAPPEDFRIGARDILSHDFLAPTTARLLGTDLPQQFLPFPILPDRGVAMERAWERAAEKIVRGTFSRSFLELALEHRPYLFLNSTEVENGRRLIFSPIRIRPFTAAPSREALFKNAGDGIDVLGGDLPVSAAVHMSARFTYVSPAGTIRNGDSVRRVVDGGYFENSGTATAAEILGFLRSPRNPQSARLSPHVILITHTEKPFPSGGVLSEELSPLRALFATRVARGEHAVAELRGAAGASWSEFNLRTDQGVPLPLGWLLSAQARRAIDEAIDSPANRNARSQIGSLLTRVPKTAARNNYADRLSQVARQKETEKGLGAAFRQIVTGR